MLRAKSFSAVRRHSVPCYYYDDERYDSPSLEGKYSDHGSTRRARRAATSRGVVSSWRPGPAKYSRCEFVTGDVGEGLVQSNVARSTVPSEQYFCDGPQSTAAKRAS